MINNENLILASSESSDFNYCMPYTCATNSDL